MDESRYRLSFSDIVSHEDEEGSDSSVKVAVMVRPFSQRELAVKTVHRVVSMCGNETKVTSDDGTVHQFAYDFSSWSFDSKNGDFAGQELVHGRLAQPLLSRAFGGYNTCLFAYGQTGSGKSYSIKGQGNEIGIIPRFCEDLFIPAQPARDINQEGANINKSLLTLGKVISLLAEQSALNGRKKTYIPYRESVLSWLLKESLGGNSKSTMIPTISPANSHIEETLSTLRYARQAWSVVNVARVNEDPKDKLIQELRAEIEHLRLQTGNVNSEEAQTGTLAEIVCLHEQLKAREKEMEEMTRSWEEQLKQSEERKIGESKLLEKITQLKHQIERYEQQAVEYNILQQRSKLLEKECSDLRYECILLKKAKQDGVNVLERKKMEDSKSLKHTIKERYMEFNNLYSEKLDSGKEGLEKHLYHKDEEKEDLVKKSYLSKNDLVSLKTEKGDLEQSQSQSLFNVESALTELTDLSKQLEEAENKRKVLNELLDKDGAESKEHGKCQIAKLDASVKDLEESKAHQKKLQHDYSVLQTDYSVLQAEFQKYNDVNDKSVQETQKKDSSIQEVEKLKNAMDELDESVEQLNNASISALEQLTAENELKTLQEIVHEVMNKEETWEQKEQEFMESIREFMKKEQTWEQKEQKYMESIRTLQDTVQDFMKKEQTWEQKEQEFMKSIRTLQDTVQDFMKKEQTWEQKEQEFMKSIRTLQDIMQKFMKKEETLEQKEQEFMESIRELMRKEQAWEQKEQELTEPIREFMKKEQAWKQKEQELMQSIRILQGVVQDQEVQIQMPWEHCKNLHHDMKEEKIKELKIGRSLQLLSIAKCFQQTQTTVQQSSKLTIAKWPQSLTFFQQNQPAVQKSSLSMPPATSNVQINPRPKGPEVFDFRSLHSGFQADISPSMGAKFLQVLYRKVYPQ